MAMARRDWAVAIEVLQQLIEVPGERRARHMQQLVGLYRRTFDKEQALHWIAQWKTVAPAQIRPWQEESMVHKEDGDYSTAIDVLRKAVSRFTDEKGLRAELARLYQEAGQLAEAERMYWQLYESTDDMTARMGWVAQLASLAERQGTTAALLAHFDELHQENAQAVAPLLAMG